MLWQIMKDNMIIESGRDQEEDFEYDNAGTTVRLELHQAEPEHFMKCIYRSKIVWHLSKFEMT